MKLEAFCLPILPFADTAHTVLSYRHTSRSQLVAVHHRYTMPSSTSSVAKGERLHTLMNTLVALPTFVAMGYSLSYLGGVLSFSPFYHLFPQLDTSTTTGSLKSHNTLNQGAVNASLNLGALAGCLSCIYLGNRLGRRKTTFLGSAIVVLGTVLMCAAFSLPQLCVGRGELSQITLAQCGTNACALLPQYIPYDTVHVSVSANR